MQPNLIISKEKPGAMIAHRGPGIVSTPSKEFQHVHITASATGNPPTSFQVGEPPSSPPSQDNALANRLQLACPSGRGALMSKRFKVTARIQPDGATFTAAGQEGRTLLLLHQKAAMGVVAYDFQGGPPFRLPAYTWALMRNHGLVIETRREQHECGWHGRFVLHTPIEIVAIEEPANPHTERKAA